MGALTPAPFGSVVHGSALELWKAFKRFEVIPIALNFDFVVISSVG